MLQCPLQLFGKLPLHPGRRSGAQEASHYPDLAASGFSYMKLRRRQRFQGALPSVGRRVLLGEF
jgi:hypothetical protein